MEPAGVATRLTVKALRGSSLAVVETEFFFSLFMGLFVDPSWFERGGYVRMPIYVLMHLRAEKILDRAVEQVRLIEIGNMSGRGKRNEA